MKASFPIIVLALCGLAGGVLAGRALAARSAVQVEGKAASSGSAASAPAPKSGAKPADGKVSKEGHDLATLRRWCLTQPIIGEEIMGQLERMDASALRQLMEDFAASQKGMVIDGGSLSWRVMAAAATELYRREGAAALKWVEGLEPNRENQSLLLWVRRAAAMESPELAKAWIDAARKQDEMSGGELMWAVVKGAASRGAEDLVKLKELFGNDLDLRVTDVEIPPNFNFKLLFESFPKSRGALSEWMSQWSARDPEGAWEHIRASLSEADGKSGRWSESYQVAQYFSGRATGGNEREALRDLVARSQDLPQELRQACYTALPASASFALSEIPDKADRVAVVSTAIEPRGSVEGALASLRALGEEELQVEAINKMVERYQSILRRRDPGEKPSYQSQQSLQARQHFEGMMEGLELSPAGRGKVDEVYRKYVGE